MILEHRDAVIRVDSAEEQFACLTASFGDQSLWEVTSQTWSSLESGESIEIATVRLQTGESVDMRFGAVFDDDDSFDGSIQSDAQPSTEWLNLVTESAIEFSKGNPPHHPGTIARFPVPAAGYANALSVPMGLIALDGASKGLYAPPRIVALNKDDLTPIGVGEFPGFDPEFWPPERLESWPLPTVLKMSAAQLEGTIQRFSACWSRVIDAWFGQDIRGYRFLDVDIRMAQHYRAILDAPAMSAYNERMNPVFASWFSKNSISS